MDLQHFVPILTMGLGILAAGALDAQGTHPAGDDKSSPPPTPPAALPEPAPLVHEADLDAPLEEVWKVFSTDEGLKLLGAAQARLDFRVGGKMQTHYDPEGVIGDEKTIENTILALEPMRMVAFRISRPPAGFPFMEAFKSTWSVATLRDLGPGRTHLRLAMLGFAADEESQRMRAFFDQGNAWVMQHLKENLERGAKTPEVMPGPSRVREAEATGDPLAPIRAEAAISAPAAEVWNCWTTSEGMKSFLTEAKIELRIGGPFELYFDPTAQEGQRGSEGCTILAYEPERMVSFSWNAPPQFGPLREKHTWVVVSLEAQGADSCVVRLVHLGFQDQAAADPKERTGWIEVRAYFSKAWPSVLQALQDHFTKPRKP